MKLYLDENLSPRIAELLRTRGLDAVSAHEASNTQLSDRAQLDYAVREGRALVTCDVGDFITLADAMIAANAEHAGIVLVSSRFKPAEFAVIADAIHEAVRLYPRGAFGAVLFLTRRVSE